ncbi:MAG TPA: hypothetical protein VKZ63_02945 [Kofleriaceae bacterium]|nr:hypothetical protein [Kofleriaceae bacterium]
MEQSRHGAPDVTLLYVRPEGAEETELDRRVGAIAERYAPWVSLKVVSPGELAGAGPDGGGLAATGSPAVLLLREGEVVGQAMGALLPARELDDAVRRAVEWPAPAAAS